MITIRKAKPHEFQEIGNLMVSVYSDLDGFPKPEEHPSYYTYLKNVGSLTENPAIELICALTDNETLAGAVVYYNDMKDYGAGDTATEEKNACGFRLLAVTKNQRGKGVGKLLVEHCVKKAKKGPSKNLIIHSTKAMQLAWEMYERMGFKRAKDLDFQVGSLSVFGFRFALD